MSKAKLDHMQERIDLLNGELWSVQEVTWNQHIILTYIMEEMKQALYLGETTPVEKYKMIRLMHMMEMLNRDLCRTHIDITESLETEDDE